MAGLYLDTKNVEFRPLTDFTKYHYTSSFYWNNRLHDSVPENERIECRSDDPSPCTYPDEPYLFSATKARHYHNYWYNELFCSFYTCVLRAYGVRTGYFSLSETPLDYVIIIMCKGAFVAGLYKENKLVDMVELYNRTEPLSSKEEKIFHGEIKSALDKWDVDELPKFIRCRRDDFHLFGHNEAGCSRFNLTRHFHIPFVTNYPSLEEIKKVNKKLFMCIKYPTKDACLKAEERAIKSQPKSKKGSPKVLPTRDRREPRYSFNKDSKAAKELILKNDGDGLANLLKEMEHCSNFEDFISSTHPETDYLCLLHFAVLKDKTEAAKILLAFRCYPSIYDEKGKTLYELCKTKEMKSIFVNAREEDEDDTRWLRSKVPTNLDFEKVPVPRPEYDSRPARDAVRNKRKEKIGKKKIHADDY